MGKIKYFGSYIIPLLALLTFNVTGIWSYFGLFFLYVFIPVVEQIIPPNTYNLAKAEKELAKEDVFFDVVLYIMVILQLVVIYFFLQSISDPSLSLSDIIARVLMMGTVLGAVGINVGHELGHKTGHPLKQFFAHLVLATSVQNHFIPYHNSGHHKDIGTPKDLSSAKKGDNFYFFAIRSQIGGYFKTWKLEAKRLKAQGKNPLYNPMVLYTLLPLALLIVIYVNFGSYILLCYFLAAVYGISILESQNYFSHYGLRRKKLPNGRYERVNARHSWNSNHIIGRVLLFELTRHSDHHHHGAKPYQIMVTRLCLSFLIFLFCSSQLWLSSLKCMA